MKMLAGPEETTRRGDLGVCHDKPLCSRLRFVPAAVVIALCILGFAAFLDPTSGNAQSAACGLTSPAFCDTFDQGPSPIRGRAGDLNPANWSVGRLAPSDFSRGGVVNPVAVAPIPPCRASFPATSVYPPDDTLICDPSSSTTAQLMTAVAIQNYGNNSYMIRRPFDFANRTGKITFDVDAFAKLLGTYIAVDLTEDPIPAPTFIEVQNFEPGPVPRNGLMIKLLNTCDPNVGPSNIMVYSNYSPTTLIPTFQNGCANIRQGFLNHFEIRISRTSLEIYGSDYSTDGGRTFPNYRRLYAAALDLPFTRGYVHMAARNHASAKYGFGPAGVYHWDNIGFDGPVISNSRAYEIPDNSTLGTYENQAIMNLGYVLLDGTTGRPAGIYDPTNSVGPLRFQGVNVDGAVAARLSLNAFLNTGSHTATMTWGWTFRFNGLTWRNRFLTGTEVQAINTVGSAGNLSLLMDVPVSDLRAGLNTLEMLPLNAPMDYPPAVANIDLILELAASGSSPTSPTNLRIIP